MSRAELLPCPFCGEKPYIRNYPDEDHWTHNVVLWNEVGCSTCGISFQSPPSFNDEDSAFALWNKRFELISPPSL